MNWFGIKNWSILKRMATTTKLTRQIIFNLFTVLCISSQEDSPSHQADAASQERSIEQIELCGYIGGTCWTACDRELTHKWDIALCPNAAAPRCCAIEPPISSTGM